MLTKQHLIHMKNKARSRTHEIRVRDCPLRKWSEHIRKSARKPRNNTLIRAFQPGWLIPEREIIQILAEEKQVYGSKQRG